MTTTSVSVPVGLDQPVVARTPGPVPPAPRPPLRQGVVQALLAGFVLSLAALTAVAIDLQSPVRLVLVLLASATGPGLLVLPVFRTASGSLRVAVVLGVSIAAHLLLALALLQLDRWVPLAAFLVAQGCIAIGQGALLIRAAHRGVDRA